MDLPVASHRERTLRAVVTISTGWQIENIGPHRHIEHSGGQLHMEVGRGFATVRITYVHGKCIETRMIGRHRELDLKHPVRLPLLFAGMIDVFIIANPSGARLSVARLSQGCQEDGTRMRRTPYGAKYGFLLIDTT